MARIFALFTVLAALLGFAPWLVPLAKQSVRLVEARDDPAAVADLGLADLDAARVAKETESALAADDIALATSFVALADARGITIDPALRERVAAANGALASTLRGAKEFGMGFLTGEPSDLAGLAGAATGDLMVWGDIRDAGREGWKLAHGEDADELILGLSAVGIAVTAGTYATVGASLPLRAGITLVKVAKRTGKLSAALGRSFMRAVRQSVDFVALRRLLKAPGAVDGPALKGVVRSDRLASLTRMLDDVAVVQSKAGTRAALEGLRIADNGNDLRRVARLADAKGPQTLAILKTLGRGAILITGALLKLVWWAFVAALYVYLLVSSFNAFCVSCARATWGGRRGRRRHKREGAPAARRRWWRREEAPVCLALPEEPRLDAPRPAPEPGRAEAERFAAAAREAMALAEAPAARAQASEDFRDPRVPGQGARPHDFWPAAAPGDAARREGVRLGQAPTGTARVQIGKRILFPRPRGRLPDQI
ncbi:hypothetical protein [Xanthobacter tagetidis]|nr:hypothetical protein [Xanthobacter tagetidis]MBB6307677.1 hypothetical protein [Xanthobacter tagetidis]